MQSHHYASHSLMNVDGKTILAWSPRLMRDIRPNLLDGNRNGMIQRGKATISLLETQ